MLLQDLADKPLPFVFTDLSLIFLKRKILKIFRAIKGSGRNAMTPCFFTQSLENYVNPLKDFMPVSTSMFARVM